MDASSYNSRNTTSTNNNTTTTNNTPYITTHTTLNNNSNPATTPPSSPPLVATTHFATPPRETWSLDLAPLTNHSQTSGASERRVNDQQRQPPLPSVRSLLTEADLINRHTPAAQHGERPRAAFNAHSRNANAYGVDAMALCALAMDEQHAAIDRGIVTAMDRNSILTRYPAIGSAQRRREEGVRRIWDPVHAERVSIDHFDARMNAANFNMLAGNLVSRADENLERARLRFDGITEEEIHRRMRDGQAIAALLTAFFLRLVNRLAWPTIDGEIEVHIHPAMAPKHYPVHSTNPAGKPQASTAGRTIWTPNIWTYTTATHSTSTACSSKTISKAWTPVKPSSSKPSVPRTTT
ncbi:hypothetical protein Q7P37_005750 [Cladosporium fusiforme]